MGCDLDQVFLALVNRSIAATWLVAAVLVLRFALRRAPKWTRCLLWSLVAARLVFSLSVPSSWSAFNLGNTPVNELGEIEYAKYTGQGVKPSAVFERPKLSVSAGTDGGQPSVTVGTEREHVYLPSLSRLWLAGAAAMLLYALVSYLKLRRRVAASMERDGVWLCDDIESPFILGVLRPRVYLPSSLAEPQRSHVLAHEAAHLARRDHWWKPLGFALLAVYWFNPALWLAYVLLCRDIELACDERVYRDMALAERVDYSRTLLEQSCARRAITACPLAFGEVSVRERVKAALSYKKPAFWAVSAAVLVCAVAAVCFLTNPKEDGPDLSLLNYRNAASLAVQNGARYAIHYPAEGDGIQPCAVDGEALARYLYAVSWKKRGAPPRSLPSPGSVEFAIEEDYRITVYQEPRVAAVRVGEERRYYRTGAGDYEAALALLTPEELSLEINDLAGYLEAVRAAESIRYMPPYLSSRAYAEPIADPALLAEVKPLLERVEKADGAPARLVDDGESFSLDGSDVRFLVCEGYLYATRFYASGNSVGTVIGKAPDGLMDALRYAAQRQAERSAASPRFVGIMGLDGYFTDEEIAPGHYLRSYAAETAHGEAAIAESFGFTIDDHSADLDGDGVTELICNCVFGGDGARRVYVYRRSGNVIERGRIDYDRLNMTAWDDWGVNSTAEWYDAASGKLLVEYASLASSTMSRTFTCEAGCDAFDWEIYAAIE